VCILTTWDAKDGFDANLLETAEEILSDEDLGHIVNFIAVDMVKVAGCEMRGQDVDIVLVLFVDFKGLKEVAEPSPLQHRHSWIRCRGGKCI